MKSPKLSPRFKNALISVSDKTGLVEFVKPLYEQGMRVVSTGGTARALREAGVKVVDVAEQTGFPEVMDGRVKTLHPRIHMALLAREKVAEDTELLQAESLAPFDLVIVNLYPFEEALKRQASEDDLIENIDIGGPSLLRGSSKNFERVTVLVDPADYLWIGEKAEVTYADRKQLAAKAFAHVSSYDAMISHTLSGDNDKYNNFSLGGSWVQTLRYGENPHQKAQWFRRRGARSGWQDAQVLQGKELSYNNLLDLDSAVALLRQLPSGATDVSAAAAAAAVAVKHNNPCGAARANSLDAAVKACLEADPVSVFGGIVAVNQAVDAASATRLAGLFLECVVAPKFTAEARQVLAAKKNLRLLEWEQLLEEDPFWRVQSLQGGFLIQTPDRVERWKDSWQVIGEKPSVTVRADLELAWAVCSQLKSNAIAIAENGQSLGLGMGQTNRVDAVELAITRMRKFHPKAVTPVLASDAFFPFRDSIERIHAAGINWVIQPGGSIKDEEVLAAARELGVNLVLTGQRHFRH